MYGNPDATYTAQAYPDAYSTNQVCLLALWLFSYFLLIWLQQLFLDASESYSLSSHTNENKKYDSRINFLFLLFEPQFILHD